MLPPGGHDDTPYRLADDRRGVAPSRPPGAGSSRSTPRLLTLLTAEAMRDIAHLLRPGHLAQLRAILDDPEASPNDRFVALELLRTRRIAAGGVLPICQDTGTAIVDGQAGRARAHRRRRRGGDRPRRLRHLSDVEPALLADGAARHVREVNTGNNLPAQIEIYATRRRRVPLPVHGQGRRLGEQELPVPGDEGAAQPRQPHARSSTRSCARSAPSACPPYHLAIVIGGTSAEYALKTAKYASARYLDDAPDRRATTLGRGFRDLELEQKVLELTQQFGIGAQFGGKYFCHDVRVVRLPRHGASCPVAIAVSCSADRQALGKITHDGVFLEELERDPAQFLPEVDRRRPRRAATSCTSTSSRPMAEIRGELSKYPVKTRLALTGPMVVARDIAHAKIKERLDAGEAMPEYLRDHCVYYAGPAKTPEGYASGSFGPTTAGRMDAYVDLFQAAGGSLVMLAKGNRSKAVTDACKRARRLLPRVDRRAGGAAREGLHHEGRGARVPRAGHGGGLEDRSASTSRHSSSWTTRATTSSRTCLGR